MKWFKISLLVCAQNFRKWPSNYRVWLIAIILLIMTHTFTKDIAAFSSKIDIQVSPWLFPFLYARGYEKLLFMFPLILLFCDAPFIDENQPYIIARSKRFPWGIGQIIYIILSSAAYFLFLIFSTIILNLNSMQFTTDWGTVLGTISNTSAYQEIRAFVSPQIMFYFTPIQAMWFTFFLSWLAGILLGLIIYSVNSITSTRSLGVLAASFLLVLDASAISARIPQSFVRFSPISWSTLGFIDIDKTSMYPPISYVYIGFALLITVFLALSIKANSKQPINVLPPV